MCLRTSKSVLSLGFSTILYSYMATLEGSPFRHSCVLNTYSSAKEDEEESDASLQTLSTLERYYEGHTGGWIHSETGDIFAYDPALKLWTSLGNLGMRLPTRSNGYTLYT